MTIPVPTHLSPCGNPTIDHNQVHLSCDVRKDPGDSVHRVKAEFKVALDAGFTTGLQTFTEPDSKLNDGGQHILIVPAGALDEGHWYLKGFSVQHAVGTSAAAICDGFTISHLSTATSVAPSGSQFVAFGSGSIDISWAVTNPEPSDGQSAYQIIVERNSDGFGIADTGKVTSIAPTGAVSISGTYKDVLLRVKVRLWNNNDNVGAYSAYSLFYVTDGATINITAPTGVVTTPVPNVTWTYAGVAGRTQAAYQIQITDTGLSELVYDSGVLFGTGTSHAVPGAILHTGHSYSTKLKIKDSGAQPLTAGFWVEDTQAFTTSWTQPAAPTFVVDATPYAASGFVKVTWTNASQDANFYAYRVYRRLSGATDWTLVSSDITTVTPTYEFDDYSAGSNVMYEYAVVQVKLLSGDQVESVYNASSPVSTAGDSYWLIDPDPAGTNFKLWHVTAEDHTDETESNEFLIIGRGRRYELGSEWGERGTLTASLRDIDGGDTARKQGLALKDLKRKGTFLWLRNPFGDVWKVAVNDIAIERQAGLGIREFVTLTIPYEEVY